MENYNEDTYGERIADIYDEWYAGYDESLVDTLSKLAQGGRALELGIGTGRVALPLQQAGIEIHGIDASEAMIAKLRAKPSGETIRVFIGNFADVAVEGQYALICILFNTFFALLTQDEQLRCFKNVAEHLTPNGVFVIEAFVPDLSRFDRQQTVRAVDVKDNEVRLDASRLDLVSQHVISQHIVLTKQGVRLYPVTLRYVWPAELDLMARLAGMRLRQRWASWQGAAFSAESGKHISIYGHV